MRFLAKISSGALAAALALGGASVAHASDGQITFTGTVTSNTCSINAGAPTFTVALPTVAASTLTAAGSVAGRTAFSISLTGCGATTGNVSGYFEQGANTDLTNNVLTNAATTGKATNVAVQLLNGNGQPIVLNANSAGQNGSTATLASGSATLKYFAQYYATAAGGAGSVSTSTFYSIVYN